jgi:hypothetical protein
VQTSAEALISDLEAASRCEVSDTLCVAEDSLARLKAAKSGLRSLVRIDQEREAIVATLRTHLALKQSIIDDYAKVDKNGQKIDTNQQANAVDFRAQIADDKVTIGDLRSKLDACRSEQKLYFVGGALAGGFVGYKLKGVTSSGGLFAQSSFAQPNAVAQPYPFSFYQQQTLTEKRVREILKAVPK